MEIIPFLLIPSLLFQFVLAQIDYAVYYDDATTYNPRGSDYSPRSPPHWNEVDGSTWPIFLDWGNILLDASKWDGGNRCSDRSSSSYNTRHRQSPLMLRGDQTCEDRHKILNVNRGVCQQNEAKFYSTAYGLAVDLTACTTSVVIDHSRNDDQFFLQEIVLKYPAEHSIQDPSTGEELKFDAELQLNHRGSNNGYNPSDSKEDDIAITSVLLKLQSGTFDRELQLLLDGWSSAVNQTYASCGKFYDHTNCVLQSANLRSGFDQGQGQSNDVPGGRRRLQTSGLNKRCNGSFYCFVNLYLHTKSHFYYNYEGSLTYPPCTENVHWRIMQQPLYISPGQLEQIKRLTYMHLNSNCELATLGVRLGDGCAVGVNRPTQSLSYRHKLKKCDQWAAENALFTDLNNNTNTTANTPANNNMMYTSASYSVSKSSTSASISSTSALISSNKNNLF
jgi:hypothetical protein